MQLYFKLIIYIELICLISHFSWAASPNYESYVNNEEKIQSIPIFIPDPCYKKAKVGSEVMLHYVFRLKNEDGMKIATSYDTNEYLSFQIGAKDVITGLHMAAKDMCIGEKKKVFIPPQFGYGPNNVKQGPFTVPGNSTLYFELEMVDTAEGPTIDIFSEIDMDGDDKITEDELVYHSLAEIHDWHAEMYQAGGEHKEKANQISQQYIDMAKEFIESNDLNQDNIIERNEFISWHDEL